MQPVGPGKDESVGGSPFPPWGPAVPPCPSPRGLHEERFHFLICLENTLESTWQAAGAPL